MNVGSKRASNRNRRLPYRSRVAYRQRQDAGGGRWIGNAPRNNHGNVAAVANRLGRIGSKIAVVTECVPAVQEVATVVQRGRQFRLGQSWRPAKLKSDGNSIRDPPCKYKRSCIRRSVAPRLHAMVARSRALLSPTRARRRRYRFPPFVLGSARLGLWNLFSFRPGRRTAELS
jgi:hypothetical protein